MEKLRINFITSSLGKGGAERVVSELANYLFGLGHSVRIIKLCYKDSVYEINEGIEIIDFSHIKINHKMDLLLKRASRLRKYVLYNSKENDIYISFQDYVSNISCLAFIGVKYRLIISERNDPLKSTLINKIMRTFLYARGDGFVFQTADAQRYFPKYIQKKSTVIFNPIKQCLPEIDKLINNKRIISVGRLTEQKNHLLLLKSFEKVKQVHKDAELYIFGDGELKSQLINYIQNNSLRDVRILPFTNNIFEEMIVSRLFVLPSNFEGMPNSLMESMAIGIPSISTDCRCGGPKELIGNNDYGILVETNNVKQLVDAICLLLDDYELSSNISKRAKKKMKDYCIENITNQWLDFIERLMNE